MSKSAAFVFILAGSLVCSIIFAGAHLQTYYPPHIENVCVDSTDTNTVVIVPVNGILFPMSFDGSKCIKYEKRCVVGKNYSGNSECLP